MAGNKREKMGTGVYIMFFLLNSGGGGGYSLLTFHQVYSFRPSYKSFITIIVQDWPFFSLGGSAFTSSKRGKTLVVLPNP